MFYIRILYNKWKNQGYIPDEIKEKFWEWICKLIYNNRNNESINVNLYKDVYASAGYGTINSELVPTKMNFWQRVLKRDI